MTKEEYIIWLKEHNNKCSINQIREFGFTEKKLSGATYWLDENGKIVAITYIDDKDIDKNFNVEIVDPSVPIQQPNTEYIIKNMQTWLDNQHYEQSVSIRDLNKKFYDKLYERKGRKYSYNR